MTPGDLLVEFYEEWIATERERLRQMYHADLGTLIVTHRGKREFATAMRYAQHLLAADPWHEDALRQLMSVRYEAGDAAGALAAFDQFAIRLRADMRTDPMPETVMLRDAIARSAPIAGVLAVAEPALRHGAAPAPFVGRSEELASDAPKPLGAGRGGRRRSYARPRRGRHWEEPARIGAGARYRSRRWSLRGR